MYPAEILPRQEYVLKMDMPKLIEAYPDLYVVRRIDGDKRSLVVKFDGDDVLLDLAYTSMVANLSVNLIGGPFVVDSHLSFHPTNKEITKDWNGEEVEIAILEGNYEVKEPCFPVYYKAKDFLEFPSFQEMTFHKENDFIVFKTKSVDNPLHEVYLNGFKKGETIKLPVKKLVNHAPTFCNYWHVVLDTCSFERPDTPIDTSDSNKPHNRILKQLRHDFLTKWGVFDIKTTYQIASSFYTKP